MPRPGYKVDTDAYFINEEPDAQKYFIKEWQIKA